MFIYIQIQHCNTWFLYIPDLMVNMLNLKGVEACIMCWLWYDMNQSWEENMINLNKNVCNFIYTWYVLACSTYMHYIIVLCILLPYDVYHVSLLYFQYVIHVMILLSHKYISLVMLLFTVGIVHTHLYNCIS